MSRSEVLVIGAGLAGCEAAWQLDRMHIGVRLIDIKPKSMTQAHQSLYFGELVCSNSLKSNNITNACGLLKQEMRILSSLTMEAAENSRVPAGDALAVDRDKFAGYITNALQGSKHIAVECREIETIPEDNCIIATGPLTTQPLAGSIAELVGRDNLFFYDAAAPILHADSIDYDKVFFASRYGHGKDYINCPMNESQYREFWNALLGAATVPVEGFEEEKIFEACMPLETLAKRGYLTLAYGPLKPKGLVDPRSGREPFAVVQLRQDDAAGSLFNMVGFQTRLKLSEQKHVFSMIPGLETAQFARFGVMHRNTFIHSPGILNNDFSFKNQPRVFFAGQITGVEGYVESAASGIVSGIMMACKLRSIEPPVFTSQTVIGALMNYVANSPEKNFQPMNANFGILAPLGKKHRDKSVKYAAYAERSLKILETIQEYIKSNTIQ